jgi:hypothetical protein
MGFALLYPSYDWCCGLFGFVDGFRVALPILRGCSGLFGFVGWVERSETHQ